MNYPARIFRDLSSVWHQDAASERVDVLAAELAAQTAARGGPLCLGLIRTDAVPKFFGLVYLLDSYGLLLRKRHRQGGDGVFVFVETKRAQQDHEYAGAVVTVLSHPEAEAPLATAA